MIRRQDVSIDKEFHALHRALTPEESAQLEANIRRDGKILDPIKLWNGTVLDGHNRLEKYDLISAGDATFPEPPFESVSLKDRAAALEWIARHQLGRRNNTPQELSYLRGKLAEAKVDEGNLSQNAIKSKPTEKVQSARGRASTGVTKATEEVATETGVSRDTVRRDMTYAEAVDTITAATSDKVGQEIRSGTLKIPKSRVVEIAAMPAVDIPKAIVNFKTGRDKPKENGKPSGGATFDPTEFDPKVNPELPSTEVDKKQPLADRIKEQNRIIESFARSLVKHFDDSVPKDPWLDESRLTIARDQIKSAASTIRLAKACDEPCPKCDGKGAKCKFCRGCGYLPKTSYEMAGGK